jgi:hypothetical protein
LAIVERRPAPFGADVEDDELDVDDEVAVEVEVGLLLTLFPTWRPEPPQPANVAVVKMTKQIFTRHSPALS